MAYFDWQHLTKPFQFAPVVQDTVENTKPLTLTPIDWVKTNLTLLRMPATKFVPYIYSSIPQIPTYKQVIPLIIGQFNYSTSTPITLLNVNDVNFDTASPSFIGIAFAVRYRIGNIAYRYVFSKSIIFNTVDAFLTNVPYPTSWLPYPSYTNQKILGNFTIEVWQTLSSYSDGVNFNNNAIKRDIFLKTGQIYFPADYGDTGNIINPIETVMLPALEYNFPMGAPPISENPDPSTYWLTN